MLLLCFLWSGLALLRGKQGRGKVLLFMGVALYVALGSASLGTLAIRTLESRFEPRPPIADPAGIIILGGGEDAEMTAATGLPHLTGAGERLVTGTKLAKDYPDALVIFSGGSASLFGDRPSGFVVASQIFKDAGIHEDRVILEGASRNTVENAIRTRKVVSRHAPIEQDRPWVLVTSAFHMPRALATFCKAGWRNIQPYPVDYRARPEPRAAWDLAGELELLNLALKEWIGFAAYFGSGRATALNPRGC